jgi:hypothetical protein
VRTILGLLQIGVKDNASGPAKAAAASIDQSLRKIEAAQKRLAAAPWGAGMQKQLDSLRASGKEMAYVQNDWNRLQQGIKDRSLSKALARSEVSTWRTSTVGAFAQVRAEAARTHSEVSKLGQVFKGGAGWLGKAALVSMGAYTTAYLGGVAARGGVSSWAERRREIFRQEMAGLTPEERQQIFASSMGLTSQYGSVSTTQTMEMARTSRNLMGDTTRGGAILEDMVKAMVVLQSTKGLSAGTSEMMRLQKGMDNLGVNAGGELGIDQVKSVIEGFVRASQIEGMDLDVGQFWQFARRSKVAGSALSNEFLTTVAPILMQDMGADTAGNAVAMAYKAFVIGARDTAAKADLQAQRDLGIRSGLGRGELVDRQMFGENPYAWAKTYLVPALEKAGVDLTNDGEVTHAIAKLSRNSNATMLLTRMVTQSEQFEKSLDQIRRTQGIEVADRARRADPFLALEDFQNAWGDLAAAIGGEGSLVIGFLNNTADAVRSFAQTIEKSPMLQDALGTAGLVGGAAATGFAGYSLYKFLAAGPALSGAAVELSAAAAALKGAAGADAVDGGGGNRRRGGRRGPGLIGGTALTLPLALSGSTADNEYMDATAEERQKMRDEARRVAEELSGPAPKPSVDNYTEFMRVVGAGSSGPPRRVGKRARDIGSSTGQTPIPSPRPSDVSAPGISDFAYPTPAPDFSSATSEAAQAGQQIKDSLSVTASPQVDTSSLQGAVNLARELMGLLRGVDAAASAAGAKAKSSVQGKVNQVYSDSGGGGW